MKNQSLESLIRTDNNYTVEERVERHKKLIVKLMDANRYADRSAKTEDKEFVISYDAMRRIVEQL